VQPQLWLTMIEKGLPVMSAVDGWMDLHAHFTPPTTPETREAQWRGLNQAKFLAAEPYHWTVDKALATMDTLGVAMQMLSPVPLSADVAQSRSWNDQGAQLVTDHPGRFGLLAGLPTYDPGEALAEIKRGDTDTHPDGYLVTTRAGGVPIADASIAPVWEELNRRHAVVFVHPSPEIDPPLNQPAALVEVTFETARAITDLLYTGFFQRYRDLTVVLAHCGGALPALSGRLALLGAEPWVPNPRNLTSDDITRDLSRLYLDTAATGLDSHLAAAVRMVAHDHIVYGGDAGVPCSNDASMGRNIEALRTSSVLGEEAEAIGHRGFELFPAAARRRQDHLAALRVTRSA
jgi:predicted TIM-barrel fold metal-dependent hydrolase